MENISSKNHQLIIFKNTNQFKNCNNKLTIYPEPLSFVGSRNICALLHKWLSSKSSIEGLLAGEQFKGK